MKKVLAVVIACVLILAIPSSYNADSYTAKPPDTDISRIEPKVASLAVNWWEQNDADGYQIEYSTTDDFTYKTTELIKIETPSTDSYRIYDLEQGKKYFVRLRSYQNANSGIRYGDWCKIRDVTTLKINQDVSWSSYSVGTKGGPISYKVPDNPAIMGGADNDEYMVALRETYKQINLRREMSDVEKLCRIQLWFNKNVKYAYKDGSKTADEKFNSAFTALKYGKSLCDGYSQLFNDLCYLAEMPCYYVFSYKEDHAWNFIKIGGYWYGYSAQNKHSYMLFTSGKCGDKDFSDMTGYDKLWKSTKCSPHGTAKTLYYIKYDYNEFMVSRDNVNADIVTSFDDINGKFMFAAIGTDNKVYYYYNYNGESQEQLLFKQYHRLSRNGDDMGAYKGENWRHNSHGVPYADFSKV